tara:strand:+ start:488 stop:826 length:339 start_codon:yes stop_codon:yes gene_type:complete
MSKSQRAKGHRFERKVAADATVALGQKVQRTIQFRGGQSEGSDVVVEPFAIECKHYKKLGGLINRAYEQATRDAKEGYIPIAICKGDRQEPLVTMGYKDFWELIKEWRERGE